MSRDVIERRECPKCGRAYRAGSFSCCAPDVTRRYVAVDALLRDDVVKAAAREICAQGINALNGRPATWELHADGFEHMARPALAAAVKHLTGGDGDA
jgi:hypothetical protein